VLVDLNFSVCPLLQGLVAVCGFVGRRRAAQPLSGVAATTKVLWRRVKSMDSLHVYELFCFQRLVEVFPPVWQELFGDDFEPGRPEKTTSRLYRCVQRSY